MNVTYGWKIEAYGIAHVFESKDDMETFANAFGIDIEGDLHAPRRCEIHHREFADVIFADIDGKEARC